VTCGGILITHRARSWGLFQFLVCDTRDRPCSHSNRTGFTHETNPVQWIRPRTPDAESYHDIIKNSINTFFQVLSKGSIPSSVDWPAPASRGCSRQNWAMLTSVHSATTSAPRMLSLRGTSSCASGLSTMATSWSVMLTALLSVAAASAPRKPSVVTCTGRCHAWRLARGSSLYICDTRYFYRIIGHWCEEPAGKGNWT
jgi:hypothetical protein